MPGKVRIREKAGFVSQFNPRAPASEDDGVCKKNISGSAGWNIESNHNCLAVRKPDRIQNDLGEMAIFHVGGPDLDVEKPNGRHSQLFNWPIANRVKNNRLVRISIRCRLDEIHEGTR